MSKKEIIKDTLSTLKSCLFLGILISVGMMLLALFIMAFGFWQWGIFSLLAELNTWIVMLRFGIGGGLLGFIMITTGNCWMGKTEHENHVNSLRENTEVRPSQNE